MAGEGGTAAIGQAGLGLTDVAGLFLEWYADCAGVSRDTALKEALAALRDPDMTEA